MSFFSRLFGNKTPQIQHDHGHHHEESTRIVFHLSNEGNVRVDVHYAEPESLEQAKSLAQGVATLVYLLSKNKLLPMIQHGISIGGELAGHPDLSQMTLEHMNRMMTTEAEMKATSASQPVISPTQVFAEPGE